MFFNFGGGGGMPGGMGGMGGRAPRDVDTTKFYTLLGVEKTADASEIKKAFRKAALQHHPDRGGDPEKFKEISKAHEILSDPEKRAIYDEAGEEGLEGGGGGGGGGGGLDLFDLFGGGAFGGAGARGRGGKKRGEDVVFPLKVTLEDLYQGTSKKLRLTKNVLCSGCKGAGGKNGAEVTCGTCKGQGARMAIRQVGPGMIQQVPVKCTACQGTGSSLSDADRCGVCAGERTLKEKKTLEVFVAKGMKHGTKVTFRGDADEAPNTIPGDVVVVLQLQPHPEFRREGNHLFVKRKVTLLEALTGFAFNITHLDGRVLHVLSEPGMVVKPGQVKCVRDEGMPTQSNPYVRGNLYVELDVDFPKPGQLDANAIRALSAVLPRPVKVDVRPSVPPPQTDGTSGTRPASDFPDLLPVYEVHLDPVQNMAHERAQHAAQQARERAEEEDDEDNEGHHHGRPQCQQQ